MSTNDDILHNVYDEFERKKQLQKEQREKEMCNSVIEQIKNQSDKTLELNIQLYDKFLTPEGQAFISKLTKGREEVRNALLANIEKLEKRNEAKENAQFMKCSVVLKEILIEINRIYYNSFEYMSYLMLT
uniref:Uncharacterized protein n=1 Tax=viral metagenome TaxID=1070528 RepID=A0A6C0IK48_9ZZZZ